MNNFFENHLEEIKLITSRSKKESRKSFSRLQKSNQYLLRMRNGETIENEIISVEGINLHQITEEGKVLFANSDRIYLPDVATRLYQNLDNILKSYKSHKVHNDNKFHKGAEETTSQIDYIDLADWDNEYFRNVLNDTYSSVSDEAKERFHIEFTLDSLYSIWNIFNPESKITEFDEFYLVLNYKIFDKEKDVLISDRFKKITNSDIRNKRIDLSGIINFINELNKIHQLKKYQAENVKPHFVFLNDSSLSRVILENFGKLEEDLKVQIKEFESIKLISEKFNKLGLSLHSEKILNTDELMRQKYYGASPQFIPRNISLANNIEPFETEEINIERTLQKIKSHSKSKPFIYVLSFQPSCDFYDENILLIPDLSIYFDGNEFFLLDLNALELLNLEEIKLSDERVQELSKIRSSDIYYGYDMPLYSYLPAKNALIV